MYETVVTNEVSEVLEMDDTQITTTDSGDATTAESEQELEPDPVPDYLGPRNGLNDGSAPYSGYEEQITDCDCCCDCCNTNYSGLVMISLILWIILAVVALTTRR